MSGSINGIDKFGMNYTPISSYNKVLSQELNNTGIDGANASLNNFQNILDNQLGKASSQPNDVNPMAINAGVSMDVQSVNPHMNIVQSGETSSISSASPVADTANSLSQALGKGITSVDAKQAEAQGAIETLASGGDISVHDVMIASQKASLNMQMAMQLRNKMLNAYNELYQMRF